MNQIKFEIGGRERGFLLGLGFLGDMLNHFDTDIQGLGRMGVNNNIFSLCPASVFYGHKHYCLSNKERFDCDIYDVENWFLDIEDGMLNENVQNLLTMMADTLTKHLGHLTDNTEESKKK